MRRILLSLTSLAVLVAAALPAGALPSVTPDPTDGVEGFRVYAVVQIGPTIYLGGEFSSVGGQPRANLAAIDAASGSVTGWDPGASDAVFALAAGPDGSLYVGGRFTRIGSERRVKLARFDPSGTLTGWAPTGSGSVRALAVDGERVYVGGVFTTVNGVLRNNAAAVDAGTAGLLGWNPSTDGRVLAIVVHPTGTVYIGGFFRTVGGQRRNGVAAVDPGTGAPTSFVSQIAIPAYSLAFQPAPGLLFVAGAGGGGTVGALDPSSGAVVWKASGNGNTQAVVASSTTVYLGGHFNIIAGQPRLHLAAFDATTGALLGWDPGANGDKGILAMARVGDRTLLITGDFTVTGNERRARFARFSGLL